MIGRLQCVGKPHQPVGVIGEQAGRIGLYARQFGPNRRIAITTLAGGLLIGGDSQAEVAGLKLGFPLLNHGINSAGGGGSGFKRIMDDARIQPPGKPNSAEDENQQPKNAVQI